MYPGFFGNYKIAIRLSVDGAQFTCQSTFCLLSFAILNGKSNVRSAGK